MNDAVLWLVLDLAGAELLVLMAYVQGAYMLPFLLARSTIRIQRRRSAVRLKGLDPAAMIVSGLVLWPIPVMLLARGAAMVMLGVAVTLALWLGCRLTVQITVTQTRVVRRLFYVIPWARRTYLGQGHAFTDGWGDWADPEALHVELGGRSLELAWGDRGSGTRCSDLAEALNAEVAALAPEAAHGVHARTSLTKAVQGEINAFGEL